MFVLGWKISLKRLTSPIRLYKIKAHLKPDFYSKNLCSLKGYVTVHKIRFILNIHSIKCALKISRVFRFARAANLLLITDLFWSLNWVSLFTSILGSGLISLFTMGDVACRWYFIYLCTRDYTMRSLTLPIFLIISIILYFKIIHMFKKYSPFIIIGNLDIYSHKTEKNTMLIIIIHIIQHLFLIIYIRSL